MIRVACLLAVLASPALSDGCPVAPDHGAVLDALFAQLQTAGSDMEARAISAQMWEYWTEAPDEPSQDMLDRGMSARAAYDFGAALEAFDKLVGYCPFYAEGYNQRAFVNFLREDYAAALPDLEQALKLDPRHVGALSGLGLTLLALGQRDAAKDALAAAVSLNPWLGERFLLRQLQGEDL